MGCGGIFGIPDRDGDASPAGGASTAAARPAAPPLSHKERRFLAEYGDRRFLVNVRYVGMLSESVIAVRELSGDVPGGYEELVLEPGAAAAATSGTPFRARETRALATEIAAQVAAVPGVCGDDREMALLTKRDGETRSMYRGNRQAWVVFSGCYPAG